MIRNVNDDNERKPFQVAIQYIFMGPYQRKYAQYE